MVIWGMKHDGVAEGMMSEAPSLWLIVVGSLGMLAAFLITLRWVTRPDQDAKNDWSEIDERIRRKL